MSNPKLRMLSLCSGIGGADLAAEWTGAIEVVGQVEIDPYCQAVLAKHWPDVKRIGDIHHVQGDEFGKIDIIVAGFPCQPHSLSGKRRAGEDDRDLWPEVVRIIRTTSPRWFVGENVSGLLSSNDRRFFGGILSNLDALGYRIGWSVYGAEEIGAPHQRDRVFIMAYATSSGQQECQATERTYHQSHSSSALAYANSEGLQATGTGKQSEASFQCGQIVADTYSDRQRIGQSESLILTECSSSPDAGIDGTQGIVADPNGEGSQIGDRCPALGWARATANRCDTGQSQSSVCRSFDGISSGLDAHRWPAGPGQEQESWEPSRVTTTKREKYRSARLKALGNAIVPQQIYPVFETIVAVEAQP